MKQGYLFINVLQLFPMGVGKTDDFLFQKRKMTAQANESDCHPMLISFHKQHCYQQAEDGDCTQNGSHHPPYRIEAKV